jgi:hypothetical protein
LVRLAGQQIYAAYLDLRELWGRDIDTGGRNGKIEMSTIGRRVDTDAS